MAEKVEMTEKFEMRDGKTVTLYLESWQKRMLKDYAKSLKLTRAIDKITIDFSKPVHLNTYRVLNKPWDDEGIEIYFTDVQKAILEEVTGLKVVDSMRLNKAMIEAKTLMIH